MSVIEIIDALETSHSVDVKTLEDSGFEVASGSRALRLAMTWDSSNSGWAQDQASGHIHRFYTWLQDDQLQLWLDGCIYRFSVPSRKRSERKRGSGASGPSSGEIKAPMPGSVLKILVAVGTSVEANTPLVIMESMKMEMTLTASSAGTVTEIRCEAGQMVEMNTLLVKLEPAPND